MTSDFCSPKPADETFSDAQRALSAIGKVMRSNVGNYVIDGKARYGLQSVKVRVTVYPNHDTSNVVIEAESDDAWDAGGKSVVNRFLEALNSGDIPEFVPDRQGMSTAKLIGMISLFLAILIPLIIVMSPERLGGGVVAADGGVLYMELNIPADIAEITLNSPGVDQFARRVAGSSTPDAVAPAFRAYANSYQRKIEEKFESEGLLIRVAPHTQFKAVTKTKDTYGLEIYKVRLLSGSHSHTEGYMYPNSLQFGN